MDTGRRGKSTGMKAKRTRRAARRNEELTFNPYGQMWPPPQLILALEPSQDLKSGVAVAQSLAAHFVSKAAVWPMPRVCDISCMAVRCVMYDRLEPNRMLPL